ncbi:hypothetical protein AU210_001645 [Fusarium oxysporum f. sp. radicis-cucumerinum]|uniref:Uncharacterized protein n=1 Tax=Fusarium oxysporum f. sp. radicis-cucumerinum TaxID=327505 RepID=A0A2H3HWU8_FUSOX|nr:hypothetical protein AU210_001645 [Fusarium oxysporum f. sp. radicis-cucumerinum]
MSSSDLDDMLQAPDATVRAILRALCQDSGTRSRALSYFESLEAINDSSRHANARRRMSLASVSNATRPFTETTTMIKRLAATIGGSLRLTMMPTFGQTTTRTATGP